MIIVNEKHICDRCGKEIKKAVSEYRYLNWVGKDSKIISLKTESIELNNYISDDRINNLNKELVVVSLDIVSTYKSKIKELELCGECRKAFEEFMKNGDE